MFNMFNMFKRKKSFFFEGEILTRLDKCTAYCPLMPEEEKALKELNQFLKKRALSVLCTSYGWDNFLNRTIFTGNVHNFINYLEDFVKRFPSKMYYLTDSGKLTIATTVQ